MKIRVLLADDHAIVREGLRLVLERARDVEIVGEAENGRSAVDASASLSPDVVVMDISMPEMNGMEATRRILEQNPRAKIIGLSAYAEPRYVLGLLDAGAMGFVHKSAAGHELVKAVQTVNAGRRYLSQEISQVLGSSANSQTGTSRTAVGILAPREREVLQLVAVGRSSKEVAARLDISVRTVEVHRRNIMTKLNLHSAAELTKYAIREGLTSVDQ